MNTRGLKKGKLKSLRAIIMIKICILKVSAIIIIIIIAIIIIIVVIICPVSRGGAASLKRNGSYF